MKILAIFWASFVSIAGLITAYVQVRAIGFQWAFWVAFPAALVVTAGIWYASRGVDLFKKVRDYPALEGRWQRAAADLVESKDRIRALEQEVERARAAGVEEGEQRVLGAHLVNSWSGRVPKLLAIATINREIALVGRLTAEAPPIGARFFVCSKTSGLIRGVVQVAVHDDDNAALYFNVVAPTVPRFWSRLVERVEYDETPPQDVELRRYEIGKHKEIDVNPAAAEIVGLGLKEA